MSRGGVEQRLDVKEHGEETTRSGFAKRNRHEAMSVADTDSSYARCDRIMHISVSLQRMSLQISIGSNGVEQPSNWTRFVFVKSEALGRS